MAVDQLAHIVLHVVYLWFDSESVPFLGDDRRWGEA